MKLPQISGKEVIKILCKKGFVVVRQKGSHVRLERNTEKGTIKLTVPLHPHLKRGTLHQIVKDSGLSENDFV